jgi:hypothetical protein
MIVVLCTRASNWIVWFHAVSMAIIRNNDCNTSVITLHCRVIDRLDWSPSRSSTQLGYARILAIILSWYSLFCTVFACEICLFQTRSDLSRDLNHTNCVHYVVTAVNTSYMFFISLDTFYKTYVSQKTFTLTYRDPGQLYRVNRVLFCIFRTYIWA